MYCVRLTSRKPAPGFQSAVEIDYVNYKDVINFLSASDKFDFQSTLGAICKTYRVGIAVVLDDIKVIAHSEEQLQKVMNDMYDSLDQGTVCHTGFKMWSFALESTGGGFHYFVGDRDSEQEWINNNLKLLKRAEVKAQ